MLSSDNCYNFLLRRRRKVHQAIHAPSRSGYFAAGSQSVIKIIWYVSVLLGPWQHLNKQQEMQNEANRIKCVKCVKQKVQKL